MRCPGCAHQAHAGDPYCGVDMDPGGGDVMQCHCRVGSPHATEDAPRYQWSSIEFAGKLPTVWLHPVGHKPGEPTGIQLVFRSRAELRELVNSLRPAAERA